MGAREVAALPRQASDGVTSLVFCGTSISSASACQFFPAFIYIHCKASPVRSVVSNQALKPGYNCSSLATLNPQEHTTSHNGLLSNPNNQPLHLPTRQHNRHSPARLRLPTNLHNHLRNPQHQTSRSPTQSPHRPTRANSRTIKQLRVRCRQHRHVSQRGHF